MIRKYIKVQVYYILCKTESLKRDDQCRAKNRVI